MKILHLPSIVGGNALGLAQGERALGFESDILTFGRSKFDYPAKIDFETEGKSKAYKLWSRLKAFYKMRKDYDLYHFNFGSSLLHAPKYGMNLLDLPFYSSKAKKIMTFQGCDARQKYPTIKRLKSQGCDMAACFESECYEGICNSGKRDNQRRKAIEKAEYYVDHMFALNPDLLHFLPQEKSSFLPYTVPEFDSIKQKSGPFFKNDKITIVHAPTQQVAKGTKYILQAIEKLKEDFPGKIRFKLVENLSWESALNIYQEADLFIDQVLLGWYGAAGVEAMKMGIPVACYIDEKNLSFIPQEMAQAIPVLNINKINCYSALKKIIEDRECLKEYGQLALDYVNYWHDPKKVAEKALASY